MVKQLLRHWKDRLMAAMGRGDQEEYAQAAQEISKLIKAKPRKRRKKKDAGSSQ